MIENLTGFQLSTQFVYNMYIQPLKWFENMALIRTNDDNFSDVRKEIVLKIYIKSFLSH